MKFITVRNGLNMFKIGNEVDERFLDYDLLLFCRLMKRVAYALNGVEWKDCASNSCGRPRGFRDQGAYAEGSFLLFIA